MDTFEVNDIVISGRKGFWKITKIESRINRYNNQMDKLLHLEMVLDEKGKTKSANAPHDIANVNWVTKIDKNFIEDGRKKDQIKWDTLLGMVDPSAIVSVANSKVEFKEPEILTKLGIPNSLMIGDENVSDSNEG